METHATRRGEHGYGLVLVLVLASVIFQVAAPEGDLARFFTVALGAGTVLAAVYTSGVHPRIVQGSAALAVAATAGALGVLIIAGDVPDAASAIVNGVLIAVAPTVVAYGLLRQLREESAVTLHSLGGVLAIYLLIGMFFSYCYGAVDRLDAGRLFAQTDMATRSDELYFSYVTLSTVGFGDLTAASDLGRTLAVTEALLGQIYLVTIVALIVSNLGTRRRRD